MARVLSGMISNVDMISGDIRAGNPATRCVNKEEIEEVVLDLLFSFCIAPVIQDYDGTILADDHGFILLNM